MGKPTGWHFIEDKEVALDCDVYLNKAHALRQAIKTGKVAEMRESEGKP